MVNRSFNTSVNHRSYAEVVQNYCEKHSATSQKKFHNSKLNKATSPVASDNAHSNVHCVHTKCVPAERNLHKLKTGCKVSHHERNVVSKGKPYMQELPLPLQNRYEVLQSIGHSESQHLSHQHGIHSDISLEGKSM